jgi:hypothetical protein
MATIIKQHTAPTSAGSAARPATGQARLTAQSPVPLMGPADPGTSTPLMGTADPKMATPVMARGVSR